MTALRRRAALFSMQCLQSEMKRIWIALFALALALPLAAQRRERDPLNSKEVDELRESRQDPEKRLKLFVEFARARMQQIQQLRTDPRLAEDRGPKLHDLLQDLGNIVDEMDDNVDMYATDKFDIRKPLKEIIEADTEFQKNLQSMKEAGASDSGLAEEIRKNYQFVLEDTTDSVNSSLASAKDTLSEQEEQAKDKKNPLRKAD
jgi:hypothetical protein